MLFRAKESIDNHHTERPLGLTVNLTPYSHSLVMGTLSIMVKSTPWLKWLMQADPCFLIIIAWTVLQQVLFCFTKEGGKSVPQQVCSFGSFVFQAWGGNGFPSYWEKYGIEVLYTFIPSSHEIHFALEEMRSHPLWCRWYSHTQE